MGLRRRGGPGRRGVGLRAYIVKEAVVVARLVLVSRWIRVAVIWIRLIKWVLKSKRAVPVIGGILYNNKNTFHKKIRHQIRQFPVP